MKGVNPMDDFEIGDKVIAIKKCDNNTLTKGVSGVVIDTDSFDRYLPIKVRFEKEIHPTRGRNWWCELSSLRKIATNERG